MGDVSSCGAEPAAAGGDMDQVTPALPPARAPRLTHSASASLQPALGLGTLIPWVWGLSSPWVLGVSSPWIWGRERPAATEMGCSHRRICTLKPNWSSSWQGGSRVWLRGMEQLWWGIKGTIGQPWRCLEDTHTRCSLGKSSLWGRF